MNKEIYNQIQEQIQAEYDEKMAALGILAGNGAVFNPKAPLKSKPKAPAAHPTNGMKVLNTIPSNGVSTRPEPPMRKDRPVKTVNCEYPKCTHRVHAENPPCEVCTKKVCALHKRGKICEECKSVGEA